MATRAKKPCAMHGCPNLEDGKERYCETHKHKEVEKQREYDKERGTAAERGYGSRWAKTRKTYLSKNPLCVHCSKEGRTTAATVVDHIIPHKGDYKLFWDKNNWQSLCKPHHDKKTATEDGGFGNYRGRGD